MGCRRALSSTLLIVILAIISLLLTLDRPVAHARHVKSPSMWAGERLSAKDEGLRQGITGKLGVEHAMKAGAVPVVKGRAGEEEEEEGAAGASLLGRGGNSPAASAEKVVVARYGPRPHPKKHN